MHRDWRRIGIAAAATLGGALAVVIAAEVAGEAFNLRRSRILPPLLGLLVLFVGAPRRWLPWALIAGGIGWVIGYLGFEVVPDAVYVSTPVSEAVGAGAFFDTPYRSQQLAAVVIAAATLLVAVRAAVWLRRRRAVAHPTPDPPAEYKPPADLPRGSRRGALAVVGGTLLAWLSVVPDIPGHVYGSTTGALGGNWDVGTTFAWQSFIQRGLVPMKDFFFPYGQSWVFQTFPLGPLWQWLVHGVGLALCAYSLWRLTGGRAGRVLVCIVALVVLAAWNGTVWRYVPALAVASTYAALEPLRHRRPTLAHLVFGFASLFAALLGLDLLFIGFAGAGLVFLGEFLSGRVELAPRKLVRPLAVDLLPLLAVLAVPVLWLLTGTAEGSSRFWFGLSATSAASTPNEALSGALAELKFAPGRDTLAVVVPGLLLLAGLVHALLSHPRQRVVDRLLLVGAGLTFALLIKHLVRPIPDAMLALPLVFLLWGAILLWDWRRPVLAAAVGAFVGATLLSFEKPREPFSPQTPDAVSTYLRSSVRAPERIADNLGLIGEGAEIERVQARQYGRERFVNFPELAMADQLRAAIRQAPDRRFAVLGDAQILYPLLNQRPPYHVELYDAAKKGEQLEMVEALEREEPPFLLWRRDFSQDGVPQSVRNPLIMRYAIDHYVPISRGPVSDVLRRRRPGDRLPVDYWHENLGDPIDLGFIPASSDALDHEECSNGDDCVQYAVIEGEPAWREQTVTLRFFAAGTSFAINIHARRGVESYPIRIDRLWFKPLLGPTPNMQVETPGFTVRHTRLRAGDDLY